ncbi:is centromere binding at prophase protein [Rutstroemia sp. NJR-2017a BBW]|nr:is centromere binding at prophase protein [Rutstroemia sp. NJR-2017a BBW]
MPSTIDPAQLGNTLIEFSSNGQFPDEQISASLVDTAVLPRAVEALSQTKLSLEIEVRNISKDKSSDIDSWIQHAQNLQNDIDRSRKLASEIVQQAEAEEARELDLKNKETHVALLEKEIIFNRQLRVALQCIKRASDELDKAEQLAGNNELCNAIRSLQGRSPSIICREMLLKLLSAAGSYMGEIPTETGVRAFQVLEYRYFDIKVAIREQLRKLRESLIRIDRERSSLEIHQTHDDNPTTLLDVSKCVMAYKELESMGKEMWDELYEAILLRRTGLEVTPSLFRLSVGKFIDDIQNTIRVTEEHVDHTIKSLFQDVEAVIHFLVDNLPKEIAMSLANAMMPELSSKIVDTWLDMAIPTSLESMVDYQKALAQAEAFAMTLESLNWPGANVFLDWVSGAPRHWLKKRKDSSLDWIRNELALGIGTPHLAEHTEQRMVTLDDSMAVTSHGENVTDDWGWGDDEEEDNAMDIDSGPPAKNRASMDEERRLSVVHPDPAAVQAALEEEDDAWGWGDDDNIVVEPLPDAGEAQPVAATSAKSEISKPAEKRNVTLSEKYSTSSMPITVFKSVTAMYEDGATLMQEVYAYNDAMWLCDQLKDFATKWQSRTDLPPRARNLVKLDSEIKYLESFGKRSYKKEMDTQRTILRDLLAGSQNFLQQGDAPAVINTVIDHIKKESANWKTILPYSTWASAVGNLINTVALKIINDVFDLTDLGIDDAERVASLILQVETLDSLFKNENDEKQMPKTAQYAKDWIKLQFLGEILQSNLKDIRYLWFESELSFCFTKEEVIDLIELSFEKNVNSRQLIKDIKEKPVQVKAHD